MSGRRIVLLGLLCGMATAVLVGAAVVAFGPDVQSAPTSPPTGAAPTAAGPTAAASPSGSTSGASPGTAPPSSSPSGSGPPAPASGSGSPGGSGPAPTPPPSPSLSSLFRVGQPAPALRVPQLAGGVVDLVELRGYPVWIEFMATYCPSCQEEFPLMNGFAARYAGDGLKVIAVDVREDEADVAAFADAMSAAFPIGLDGDGSAARSWGVVGLPVHFFIDASGVIRDAALGGAPADVLARGVGRIMPGVTVAP